VLYSHEIKAAITLTAKRQGRTESQEEPRTVDQSFLPYLLGYTEVNHLTSFLHQLSSSLLSQTHQVLTVYFQQLISGLETPIL